MNFTISSLILTSLITSSPAFICNRYSIFKSNFQKFSSSLFVNQENLFLKSSTFAHGLNGVIFNDNAIIQEGNHITLKNEENSFSMEESIKKYSITVIECSFLSIISKPCIKIKGYYLSIYITQSSFTQCCGKDDGIIHLESSRCLTLTHTCTYECKAKGEKSFLYYDCVKQDFSIFLYNTIAKTQKMDDDYKSSFSIFCKSGSQYFRCNNITDLVCNAYQFEAPQCFSFGMNTVFDCELRALTITGYKKNQSEICEQIFDKTISNVNLFVNGNEPIFYFHSACSFKIILDNCVLLSKNNKFVEKSENTIVHITFKDCVLNHDINDGSDCEYVGNFQYVDYDKAHLTIFPHYTHGQCEGPQREDEENKALGCNAGNCIDTECGRTIGFPDEVVPYTTILFTDINTPTPSPTKMFSKSSEFSNSVSFSKSDFFSKSFAFSSSVKFSATKGFSGTDAFSKTEVFSLTGDFTKSTIFSDSGKFTNSAKFSSSNKFSKTKEFSKTEVFSETTEFTRTDDFSISNIFTRSNNFTPSLDIIYTHSFTPSLSFSPSNQFSSSEYFSFSPKFSQSNSFNSTIPFSRSDWFSPSKKFEDVNFIVTTEKPKNKAALIGGVAGAAAAALIIAGLIFFFVKKRRRIETSDINMLETQDSMITMDNDLQDMMDSDDPFAVDFANNK